MKLMNKLQLTCLATIAIALLYACSSERSPQPVPTTGGQANPYQTPAQPYQTPTPQQGVGIFPQPGQVNWNTPVGGNLPGMQNVNLVGIDVNRDGRVIKLTEILNNERRPKAVIQVIDILPGGALCSGCMAKANTIAGDVRGNAIISNNTTYIIVLSGVGFTPSDQSMAALKSNITHDVILVKDINGRFAGQFGQGFPPTAVLDHHQHGKILNMHVGQPPEVTTALMGLTD